MTDTGLRVLGGGPSPFAPQRRTMTSAEILRVLSLDPRRSMDRGRLAGTRDRLGDPRRTGGLSQEQRLIDWLLETHTTRSPGRVYVNPARLPEGARKPRALDQADFEYLRSFEGVAPASVPAEDVKLLAELEASAEGESARRVVARVFGPIRRHHDRLEEEAELRNQIDRVSSSWRTSTVRDAWLPVLRERLAQEARAELEPELTGLAPDLRDRTLKMAESEAERSAPARIAERWAELDREANVRRAAAQERLQALAAGADPESSAVRTSASSSYEEGRRRGREEREAREARSRAFANFEAVS